MAMVKSEKKDMEAQVKSADMTEEMQQQSIDVAREAMDKHTIEKDIAQAIKKEFDSRFGATWHCIVGRNFGSFVTHGEWSYIPDAFSLGGRKERTLMEAHLNPVMLTNTMVRQKPSTSYISTWDIVLYYFSRLNSRYAFRVIGQTDQHHLQRCFGVVKRFQQRASID
ncbi:MAG: Dynein light chain [Ramalina farinacea]|uniref:Dynein light chain n=1 Tax=Ramalina farinacea TaxID=258253 RepID=A0AA43QQI0_9LECA|nr:Dynein light chain [Ramalina farinacea]